MVKRHVPCNDENKKKKPRGAIVGRIFRSDARAFRGENCAFRWRLDGRTRVYSYDGYNKTAAAAQRQRSFIGWMMRRTPFWCERSGSTASETAFHFSLTRTRFGSVAVRSWRATVVWRASGRRTGEGNAREPEWDGKTGISKQAWPSALSRQSSRLRRQCVRRGRNDRVRSFSVYNLFGQKPRQNDRTEQRPW